MDPGRVPEVGGVSARARVCVTLSDLECVGAVSRLLPHAVIALAWAQLPERACVCAVVRAVTLPMLSLKGSGEWVFLNCGRVSVCTGDLLVL